MNKEIRDYIQKLLDFSNSFLAQLTDDTKSRESKLVYFMDQKETLKKFKEKTDQVILNLESLKESGDPQEIQEADAFIEIILDAKNAMNQSILKLQENTLINSEVTEDQLQHIELTEESVTQAKADNATTKKMIDSIAVAERYLMETATQQVVIENIKSKEDLIQMLENCEANGHVVLALYKLTPVNLVRKTTFAL